MESGGWRPVHQLNKRKTLQRLLCQCFTEPTCNPSLISLSPPLPPLTYTSPDHRHSLVLGEQLMGVLQPHDWRGSQSADELQAKPREGLSGTLHTASSFLRLTGSLSNVPATSQRHCSTSVSLQLSLLLSTTLFLSILVCFLFSLHSSLVSPKPAEHATQIQQLLWPSLA